MKHLPALIVVLFLLLSAGCAVDPGAPSEAAPGISRRSRACFRPQGDTNNASLRAEYQLEAAKRLQNEGDHPSARRLLDSVQTEQLGQAAERIYEWLKARDVVSRSSREDAEALASRIPPDLLSRLPSAERKHAVRDLANLYELADQPLKTFRVLINGYAVIDESEWQPYNERVWKALKPSPTTASEMPPAEHPMPTRKAGLNWPCRCAQPIASPLNPGLKPFASGSRTGILTPAHARCRMN